MEESIRIQREQHKAKRDAEKRPVDPALQKLVESFNRSLIEKFSKAILDGTAKPVPGAKSITMKLRVKS